MPRGDQNGSWRPWYYDPSKVNQPFLNVAMSRSWLLLTIVVSAVFVALLTIEPVGALVGLPAWQVATLALVTFSPSLAYRLTASMPYQSRLAILLAMTVFDLALIPLCIALGGRPATPLWGFYYAHVMAFAASSGLQPFFMGYIIFMGLAPGAYFQWGLGLGAEAWFAVLVFTFVAAWLYSFVGSLSDRTLVLQRRADLAARHQALAEQRETISREIHDGLGAQLTASTLLGNVALRLLESGTGSETDRIRETLHAIQQRLKAALSESRQVLWSLDPTGGTPEELLARIHRQLGDICEAAGLIFSSTGELGEGSAHMQLPTPIKHQVYRIAQEAITNVVRHAQAAHVAVHLRVAEGRLVLSVVDDGQGMALPPPDGIGHGLGNMQARATQIGGRLEVKVPPTGRGTEIRLEAPLEHQSAGNPPRPMRATPATAAGDTEAHMPAKRAHHTVGIVEDDPTQCRSLELLLEGQRGFHVSFAVHEASEALSRITASAPDVLIVDLGLPDMDGIELIAKASPLAPKMETMVFTINEDDRSIFDALRAGATGYVTKDASPEQILDALDNLLSGGSPISPAIARRVVEELAARPAETTVAGPQAQLTDREREIMALLAQGYTYLNIASRLGLSTHTVHAHIRRVYKKLRVGSRSEAVFEALRGGYVKVGPRRTQTR